MSFHPNIGDFLMGCAATACAFIGIFTIGYYLKPYVDRRLRLRRWNKIRNKKVSPAKKSRSTFTIETWLIPTIAVSVILLMLYLLFFRGHHNDGSANWWVMSIIAIILLAAIIRSQYKGSFNLPSFKGKGFSGLDSFFSSFWSWFAKAWWKLAAVVLFVLWLWPRYQHDDYGSKPHVQNNVSYQPAHSSVEQNFPQPEVSYGLHYFEKGKWYKFSVKEGKHWFVHKNDETIIRDTMLGDGDAYYAVQAVNMSDSVNVISTKLKLKQ
ncbi:MAG: hypothetical protein JWM92_304 [Candidatus Nomurabacteria bacterium]|nr:hypothetical protein [Candidatus Nomurabacteria bacterium]